MGIVKFYQWVTNRYPCVSRVIKYNEIPDFDNLYVDVNSIIYAGFGDEDCSSENSLSEQIIFIRIFQYLEAIFEFVRPKNLFFIAVDGVSPCAKANSQRGGLFSSYPVNDDQEPGFSLEPVFDKSSIKPGTKFMARLQECFKYFINKKLSTDPAWQNVEVILSGHHVPGEGEHKIMDYIRYQKAQPGYNPNTRHCVYGLDADLILLGLVTHEPHFTLLYEKFSFVQKKSIIPHTFYIMYLSLLREYIDAEFSSLQIPFAYNLEPVIDDFVFFGCLLGNDFIPSLPGMRNKEDILSVLFKKYREVLPSLQGYIHENGSLNMARFERYMTALAEDNFDDKTLEERLACYNERMNMNEQGVDHLVESFVTGVQWILHYYYTGVPSWDWFYPYHYAPFVSDLKGFSSLQPVFELGQPFLAFEQMLACVPPTLAYHLPEPYQGLVISRDSPIIEFYPTTFKEVYITNGKWDDRKAWIHITHLPFIDKDRLLKAMEPFNDKLTDEEIERNTQGSCLSYRYDHQKLSGHTYHSPCPSHFLDILNCKSSCTDLSSDPFPIKKENIVFGLRKGVSLDLYFPQFPTFRHISHTVNDCNEDRCFTNQDYRCINILPQVETAHLGMQSLAEKLLGKTCYVRWPYMAEAKVSGLFYPDTKYVCYHDSSRRDHKVQLQTAQWKLRAVVKNYWERQAIKISELEVIVEVQELQGVRYGSKAYDQQWSRSYTYYPLQTIVMHRPEDAVQHHQDGLKSLSELFKKGDTCFVLKPGSDLYGKQAEVSSVDTLNEQVYVKVIVEPKIEAAVHTCEEPRARYYPIDQVANRLNINRDILKKIIGSLFCEEGSATNEHPSPRSNIGLKLQFFKKKLPGYTQWIKSKVLLSQAAVDLINEYEKKFPSVFRYLREHQPNSKYYESDLFPADTTSADDDDYDSGLEACLDWLESLPTRDMELVDSSCEALEQSQIKEVQSKIKRIVQMEPVQLFKPTDQGGLIPDPDASYELLDRVVNVSKNCAVPFGLRGTVIGITKGEPDNSSVYEVLYDEEFTGGLSIRGSMRSAYYHPPSYLINLTHGTRMTQQCQNVVQRRKGSYSSSQPHHYNGHEERSRDHHDQGWRSERDEYRRYGERDHRGESDWRDRDQDRDRGRDYDGDRGYQTRDRDHYRERDSYRDSGPYRDQDRYRDRERESGYREKDRQDVGTWQHSSVRNQYGGDRYPPHRDDRQNSRGGDWRSRQDSSVRRGGENEGWERVYRRR